MGLVQHEGGPCGGFSNHTNLDKVSQKTPESFMSRRLLSSECIASNIFFSLTEERRACALVRSLSEILFLCGSTKRDVVVSLNIHYKDTEGTGDGSEDEKIGKALEGLSIESGSDLQKMLRVTTYTTVPAASQKSESMLPVFRSRLGAMLFLISALLSRGLSGSHAYWE